jgi:hypothetical protein
MSNPANSRKGNTSLNLPWATLSSWGHSELIGTEKLVVDRVGYGRVMFLDPVDLEASRNALETL